MLYKYAYSIIIEAVPDNAKKKRREAEKKQREKRF